jgi:PAS domain S-box-containing protein
VIQDTPAGSSFFVNDDRLNVLADSMSHIVWSTDSAGVFDFANARWKEYTHEPLPGADGADWLNVIHPADRDGVSDTFRRCLLSGEPFEAEFRMRRWDGVYRWHLSRGVPHRENGEIVRWVGTSTDIEDLKRAHSALRDREREAHKMEAVGRLAGGVAHDFNNLLTVIKGHAEFLSRDLPADGELREDIEQITKAAQRAARLTRQLLAFSRQQVMQKQILDPNVLLRDLETMLARLIGDEIDLHVSLQPDLPAVCADGGQVEQAVMNLVVNARDAMPAGGDLRITSRSVMVTSAELERHPEAKPGSYVAIHVSDSGSGIDPEFLPRIFEPFFTTTDSRKGAGLGLATVHGIAQQLEGFVDVSSTPGKGSEFTLFLPALPADSTSEVMRATVQRASGDEMILLVEDQDEVRSVARRILMTNGYQVLEARNGVEALELLQEIEGDVDLVLTDAVMPQMGGPDLVRALRVKRPLWPVVIVSGYTNRELVTYGANELDVPFLAKPFRADDLLRTVRKAITAAA